MVKSIFSIIFWVSLPFISFASVDEFMSCDRYFESRRQSRVLENIPCDMSKVTFCKHKGPSYPEAAIWRFKEENRALMRRMYGDMESTSVYRQMRSSMEQNSEPQEEEFQSVTLGSGFMPDLFSSLEYNIRMGSGLATVQSAKEPIVERMDGKIKVKRKIVKKKVKNSEAEVKVETSTTSSTSSVFATTSESPSPASTTSKVPSPTTTQPVMTTQPFDEVTILESDDTTTDFPMESKETDEFFAQLDLTPFEDYESEIEAEIEPEIETEEFEEVEEIDYSGNSLNACPVKEEVFAPYWANNTRNQVLALLNLYPFEQYIHMETCKFEHEEMLCRKGCRCEQQYRLHRLLAFDPNNECRGIFSDWFRFPSYCICKCYNIPEEFMAQRKRKPKAEFDPNTLRNVEVKQVKADEIDPEFLQNIPAFLPYEAKQALLRELSRKDRKMSVQEMNAAAHALEEVEEKSTNHFFYGNSPVMEFNLANGESGSVGQTPRK